MAARRAPSRRVEFPADIHRIAADIRRQALQHPDRDPVVPGAPRPRKKRKAAKPAAKRKRAKKVTATKRRARKTTRARRR